MGIWLAVWPGPVHAACLAILKEVRLCAARAGNADRLLFGRRQRRQQQSRQNGNDRNNHQQFNQGEAAVSFVKVTFHG